MAKKFWIHQKIHGCQSYLISFEDLFEMSNYLLHTDMLKAILNAAGNIPFLDRFGKKNIGSLVADSSATEKWWQVSNRCERKRL